MPAYLSPAIMARLALPPNSFVDSGIQYQAEISRGQGMDGVGNDTLLGYMSYPVGQSAPGQQYAGYDTSGRYVGQGVFQKVNATQDFLMFIVTAVALAFGVPLMLGEAGAAGAGVTGLADGASLDVASGGIGDAVGSASVPWEAGFEGTGAISGADAIPGAGLVDAGSIETVSAAGSVPALTETGSTLSLNSLGGMASSVSKILGLVSTLTGLGGGGAGGGSQGPQPGGGDPSTYPPANQGNNALLWVAAGAAVLLAIN